MSKFYAGKFVVIGVNPLGYCIMRALQTCQLISELTSSLLISPVDEPRAWYLDDIF